MPVAPPLAPHEQARANLYGLFAALLLAPPDAPLLAALEAAGDDVQPPAQASAGGAEPALKSHWRRLVAAANPRQAGELRAQFDALFVGVDPRIDPYASRYRTGYLMDVPLASLRADLHALGLARRGASAETEDHLGALCEVMRVLVGGVPGIEARPLAEQRRFFETHIAPWYGACLQDIRAASGAQFHGVLADVVQAFLDAEARAFELERDEACT
jgi:TorA maturation chaperone TorD